MNRVKGNADRARQLHALDEADRAKAMKAEAAGEYELAKAAAEVVTQVPVSHCVTDGARVYLIPPLVDTVCLKLALQKCISSSLHNFGPHLCSKYFSPRAILFKGSCFSVSRQT